MAAITAARAATQPVNTRTGGSTFKNPPGAKAWELVDRAGCRGLVHGDAQVSELHTNFLINRGAASAADIEELGEIVRARVFDASGIRLEWEIARVGTPPPPCCASVPLPRCAGEDPPSRSGEGSRRTRSMGAERPARRIEA